MSDDEYDEIRRFIDQLAQACKAAESDAHVYQAALPGVLRTMQAPAGIIWTVGEGGRIDAAAHQGLETTGITASPEAEQAHHALVPVLLGNEGGLVVPPRAQVTGPDGGVLATNATDLYVVAMPFDRGGGRAGVVEVFQAPPQEQVTPDFLEQIFRGYLVFLGRVALEITKALGKLQQIAVTQRETALTHAEQFARRVHESLDPRATAFVLAAEARRIIGCDRVGVLVRRRGRLVLDAVSGQDSVEKRASAVQAIEALVRVVAKAGEPLWHPDPGRELPPQIEEELENYIDESHTTALAIIPLAKPRPTPVVKPGGVDATAVAKAEAAPAQAPEPIGALVAEWFTASTFDGGTRARVELVADHGRLALANALAHTTLPLYPVINLVGKSRVLTTARNLPRTILALLAALATLAALVFVPAELRLEGKGTLEPVRRRDVFAGSEGVVDKLEPGLDHGSVVKSGQLLATLRNTDLDVALADVLGRKASSEEELASTKRSLLEDDKISADEKVRLAGRKAQLQREIESLEQQERLYREKKNDLEVRSPIGGVIVTWQVRDRLLLRPVEKGQVLMSVADKAGPWELEVRMPDDRLGHVNRAVAEAREAGRDLQVDYVLATDPGTRHQGVVREIHEQAEVHGEEGNTVLVRVTIDPDRHEKEELGAGASVTARIACGKRPLGYVWFHDVLAFIRTQVLFRLW